MRGLDETSISSSVLDCMDIRRLEWMDGIYLFWADQFVSGLALGVREAKELLSSSSSSSLLVVAVASVLADCRSGVGMF